MTRRLLPRHPSMGLLFVSTGTQHQDREEAIKRQVTEAKLGDAYLQQEDLAEILPAIKLADLLLRCTATDGDSLIIREGLLVGTPVIATDVIKRPAGCLVYRNADLDDLEQKIEAVLSGSAAGLSNKEQVAHAGADVLEIYKQLLS